MSGISSKVGRQTGTSGQSATRQGSSLVGADGETIARRTVLAAGAPDMPGHSIDTVSRFLEQVDKLDQLDDVGAAERLSELKRIFSEACTALGFEYFTYHVVRSGGLVPGVGRLPYIISSYPAAWIRHYFSENYLTEDPVVSTLLERREPFVWSETTNIASFNRRQRTLFDEARDAGIFDGLTVPIHEGEAVAALSLVPRQFGDASVALRDHQRMLFHLMALRYHGLAGRTLVEQALTGESTRRRSLLSPRETEILGWVAKGKSNWEISAILGISAKSVEFHLDGARRKLKVFNRTHAVAKAIMLRLISPV